MSFLFKSKKQGLPPASRNLASADGSSIASSTFVNEKQMGHATPPSVAANTPLINRSNGPSPGPDQNRTRGRAGSDLNAPRGPGFPAPQRPTDNSLYPWSKSRLSFTASQANPFPRYGAAVNAVSSKEGDVYLMGGLIAGSTVKGDLWVVEAGSPGLNCYPVPTTAEGPGPRVGHASLLVGNAFIVFGGDTKVDDMDVLDDTLYLLNTSTKHWSRALPAGPRPAGRYGHTLNILGSKIYIFGGQVEGYFFNDLVAFDLNALQQPNNRWETLIQNTNDGGPPQGQSPPARTNHSMVTWNDRLYLFGGTDGMNWFNDVWMYDPRINSWSLQECIGFIPPAREGHAAAIVGDVMYVFGGRTEEGKDLGDLAAFRIPTRRWYTFQNMGPSPSPRSGHGMTAFGDLIYVLGGEPSSAPRDPGELSLSYVLDTAKIRYPSDKPPIPGSGSRRPSVGSRAGSTERSMSREGQINGAKLRNKESQESIQSYQNPQEVGVGKNYQQTAPNVRSVRTPTNNMSQPGPPPQQQLPQPRMNGNGVRVPMASGMNGRDSPRMMQKMDRGINNESTTPTGRSQEFQSEDPVQNTVNPDYTQSRDRPESQAYVPTAPIVTQNRNTTQAPTDQYAQQSANQPSNNVSQQQQQAKQPAAVSDHGPVQSISKTPSRQEPDSPAVRIPGQFPVDSVVDSGLASSPAVGHQNEVLLKDLENTRSKNQWLASELALARKAGYRSSTLENDSNGRSLDAVRDEDKPLLEALLKMRSDLASVQASLNSQTSLASEKIAHLERQRDTAIAEAVAAKQRLIGRGTDSREGFRSAVTPDSDRSEDNARRLATALAAQNELNAKVNDLTSQIEAERKARELAETSGDSAHAKVSELDAQRQKHTSELENLRNELHEAEKTSRQAEADYAEAVTSLQLLQSDHTDLSEKLTTAHSNAQHHVTVLGGIREAYTSTLEKSSVLEKQLENERLQRNSAEEKLVRLRAEHEANVTDLENVTKRLQDAEELSASHATELTKHRDLVLAGFGKSTSGSNDNPVNDEVVNVLKERLEAATVLARQNQAAADQASEKVRRAEERIAGLEQYQEQISREALNMRKGLQVSSRDAAALQQQHAELQQQFVNHQLDSRALQLQHSALKDILEERGFDTSDLAQNRNSGNTTSSTAERIAELQQQVEASNQAHDEIRASFEQREAEANRRLTALDSDYQSAVKYLRGTEKMLSKMKQELQRSKTQNKELEDQLVKVGEENGGSSAEREAERTSMLKKIEDMQAHVTQSNSQLNKHMAELETAQIERDNLRRELAASNERTRTESDSLREQNTQLEQRAVAAEQRIQYLLEHVGTTVNNYRRESQVLHNGPFNNNHTRGASVNSVGDSLYSASADNEGEIMSRNSVALDSLANELETLRNHWETTKNHRLSDRSDFEKTPTVDNNDGLADWRKRLDLEHFDDDDTLTSKAEGSSHHQS